jgi:hypothetical protein
MRGPAIQIQRSPEQKRNQPARRADSWARLEGFLEEHRRRRGPQTGIEAFERELHARVAEVEREILAEELGRLDVDVPALLLEGVLHRRILRCEATYLSAAGPVRVERSLYSTRDGGERAVVPLELRAGIIEGHWTPLAAHQAAWVVTHMTPQEGEDLFKTLGSMEPSKSSLDRLPKQLSERWEEQREHFEEALRESDIVPPEATTVAISLDGVMVPMKDGERSKKREQNKAQGKLACGPAGHQEVGCGTISFYDAEGERLSTVRLARMPEHKKVTLKEMLSAELGAALTQRPELRLVTIADGANDNWDYLHSALPLSTEVIDFFHATEHLNTALASVYGEGTAACHAQFGKLRVLLLEDAMGVEKVIRSLVHLQRVHPGRGAVATELRYFRKNRHRMRYAGYRNQNLPIGSGVVEAACKTLVTQRMKRSGMRWRPQGGQAILTLRALAQSDRFDHAWALLAATYRVEVRMLEKVVPLHANRR